MSGMSRLSGGLAGLVWAVALSWGCGAAPSPEAALAPAPAVKPVTAAEAPFSLNTAYVVKGETCPAGTRTATLAEVSRVPHRMCLLVGNNQSVRLDDGASMVAVAGSCTRSAESPETLANVLCVAPPQKTHRCYWMETHSGQYRWQTFSPRLFVANGRQACRALDSCDGGHSRSGGGCYKWATSPDAPRVPWDAP